MGGRVDLTRSRLCVLLFSLSLIWMFSPEISLSLCPILFLSPPFVLLSLTPFSSLRLDHQERRRVKFSFFNLFLSSSALSVPVLLVTHLFPFRPPFITADFCTCLSFSVSIVHHGRALTETQLNLKLPQVFNWFTQKTFDVLFIINYMWITSRPKSESPHTEMTIRFIFQHTPIHMCTLKHTKSTCTQPPAVYHLL